jgi:excisionase family DNA binding protein
MEVPMLRVRPKKINCPTDLANRLSLGVMELAAVMGVGKTFIYLAAARGEVRLSKIGGRTLIDMTEAKRWIAGEPVVTAPMPPTKAKAKAKADAGRAE